MLGDTNLGPETISHAHAEEKKTAAAAASANVKGNDENKTEAPAPEVKVWKFGDPAKPQLGVDYMPMPTKRGEAIHGILDGKHVEMTSQIQLCAM